MYQLTFVNESSNESTIIIFQKDPDPSPGEYSLAWLTKSAVQRDFKGVFDWKQGYEFVSGWMEGLQPGKVFTAGDSVKADLENTNAITLARKTGDMEYAFSDQRRGPVAGSLLITNATDIPANTIAEGIAMSGKAAFIVEAQPNIEVLFKPKPEYWIAYGDFEQGEILDSALMAQADVLEDVLGTKQIYGLPTEVRFPAGVFSATATLDSNNAWTITY